MITDKGGEKMKCRNCGREISDKDAYCIYCGEKVPRPQPQTSYQTNTAGQQTTAGQQMMGQQASVQKPQIGSFPKLADGEKIVKEYLCSALTFPRCEGRIAVTNRRVIFHGCGNASNRIVQEVDLQEVKGITSYYGMNFDWKKIIIGFLLVIVALSMFSNMSGSSYYGYSSGADSGVLFGFLLLILGIFLIVLGIKKIFVLEVNATACSAAISIGEGPTSKTGNAAIFAVQGQPTDETDRMMVEIGALIMDLQTLGEYAYEKWGVK